MPTLSSTSLSTLTLAIAGLVLGGCNEYDRAANDQAERDQARDRVNSSQETRRDPRAVDNSGQNVADRNSGSVTPLDQGTSARDIEITRSIRKLVTDEKNLSMNGRNVKIITRDSAVTLRGPVESLDEQQRIVAMAHQAANVLSVDNQLAVR